MKRLLQELLWRRVKRPTTPTFYVEPGTTIVLSGTVGVGLTIEVTDGS